jgi:hypothetical protein
MHALADIFVTAFINLASWNVDPPAPEPSIMVPKPPARDALGRFVRVAT